MSEKELAKLKESYSYQPGSYKYVPKGSEILKYVDQDVLMITYKRIDEPTGEFDKDNKEIIKSRWETSGTRAFIVSISDHNSFDMTYLCKYKVGDEEEVKETRIIPEGYEYSVGTDVAEFIRFVPYSIHTKMTEDQIFYSRVADLYDKKEPVKFDDLKTISGSKNQRQILRYSHNLGAAVKLEDGTVLWIRLHTLNLKHRQGDKFGLFFSDEDGKQWSTLVTPSDTEYTLTGLGTFKILDLAD